MHSGKYFSDRIRHRYSCSVDDLHFYIFIIIVKVIIIGVNGSSVQMRILHSAQPRFQRFKEALIFNIYCRDIFGLNSCELLNNKLCSCSLD